MTERSRDRFKRGGRGGEVGRGWKEEHREKEVKRGR